MSSATPRVLVLAAGRSRRFGADKRRTPLPSVEPATADADRASPTLLEATLSTLGSLDWPIQVALRAEDAPLSEALTTSAAGLGIKHWLPPLLVADAVLGQGHTLAAGARQALRDDVSHLLVALGDMPFLMPATLQKVTQELLQQTPANLKVVRPRSAAGPGNPVGFTRPALDALTALQGDSGARELLKRWQAQTCWIDVEDSGIHQDVDRPEDLKPR